MVLGMSLPMFTLVHIAISVVAIALGFVVLGGLLKSDRMPSATAWFLILTIATSVTGFFFPFTTLLPSHITGILSLVLLAIAVYALYVKKLSGIWRGAYVVTALLALWFNVFVFIVQSFIRFPALQTLAPKQAEPPFLVTQGLTLAVFVIVIFFALKKFRPVT